MGTWSVAQTAAHVAVVASSYTSLLPAMTKPHPIPGVDTRMRQTALDELGGLNEYTLQHLTERDPMVLAVRVGSAVEQLLAISDDLDPLRRVGWLGDAQLPIAGWYAHLLNELLLHGRDIAGAVGAPWAIPQRDAAMAFEMFLVTLLSGDTGRLLEHEPMSRSRIAIRFRSRYTTPVTLVAQDSRMGVEPPDRTAVDATLFFEPAALMLILFNRLGKVRSALTGRVVVWGRRPWLLPAFLRAVRFP